MGKPALGRGEGAGSDVATRERRGAATGGEQQRNGGRAGGGRGGGAIPDTETPQREA